MTVCHVTMRININLLWAQLIHAAFAAVLFLTALIAIMTPQNAQNVLAVTTYQTLMAMEATPAAFSAQVIQCTYRVTMMVQVWKHKQ